MAAVQRAGECLMGTVPWGACAGHAMPADLLRTDQASWSRKAAIPPLGRRQAPLGSGRRTEQAQLQPTATGQPGTKGLAWPQHRQCVCPGLGRWFRLVQGGSCFQGEHAPNCSFTDRKAPNLAVLSLKTVGPCHLFLPDSDLRFQ